jgi:hypothetical protein
MATCIFARKEGCLLKFIALQAVAYAATLIYSSYFEWVLHRFFMHRPTLFHYPFRAHAQIHHQVFKADKSYHLDDENNKWLITFAWWNYPLLLGLHAPVMIALEMAGLHVTAGIILGMSTYYFTYEYLHFCMHSPKSRFFENWKVFQFINRHHLIHHKYMHRNLNVVMPLADLTLGTLILKPRHALEGAPVLTPEELAAR